MIKRYTVETGGIKETSLGWEACAYDGERAFDDYREAMEYFAECREGLRDAFRVEWNSWNSPRMMRGRGYFAEVTVDEYETAEDSEDGYPANTEALDYAQYTYRDWQEEKEAE